MPVYLKPKIRRIELENGEWVDVNESLPYETVWPIISQASTNETENMKLAIPLLEASVINWRMLNEDNQEVPYSKEMLPKLPVSLALKLFTECAGIFVMDKKKPEPSGE